MSTASEALARNEKITNLLAEQRQIIEDFRTGEEWVKGKEAEVRRCVEELEAKKKEITEKDERVKAIDEELAQLLVGGRPQEAVKKARGRPPKKKTEEAPAVPPSQKRRAATEGEQEPGLLGLDLLRKVIGPQMPVGLKVSEILATANTLNLLAGSTDPGSDVLALMEQAVKEGWVVKAPETKRYTLTEAVVEQQEVA
jgi:hypothetical protein